MDIKTQEALKIAIKEMSIYAMQHANDWLIDDVDLIKAIQTCKEALAELQEHDNEVIEKCAKVCIAKANELKEFIDQDCIVGKADIGAIICAQEIRALKGK